MAGSKPFFRRKLLPGFGLSLGITLFYLSAVVLIPLSMLFVKSFDLSAAAYWQIISSDRVLAAFRVSFMSAGISAVINAVFGFLIAWVQIRYQYPGRRIVDAMIDLPFALPTSVAGISLTAAFSVTGILGFWLDKIGVRVAYTSLGIIVAMTFVGLPFVIRTLEPVMQQLGKDYEEAGTILGGNRWQVFTRVIFPLLLPATMTGAAMAFARALGEYGSVIFIAGNMPYKTEIVPLLIISKLEQFDYSAATAIAVTMLGLSFLVLLMINVLQGWQRRRVTSL